MVTKFLKILEIIEKDKGDVSLFVLVKMDATDVWSLILAADWVKDKPDSELFSYVIDLLVSHLGTEVSKISRIGLFPTYNKMVELMLKSVSVDKDSQPVRMRDVRFNGYYFSEAIFFKSL